MNRAEFCQDILQRKIAPIAAGNVAERIRLCAQRLGWSISRTRDVWYADYRVRIRPEEIEKIEQIAGVRYERSEASKVKGAISRADAFLADEDENFHRAFDAAMRTFISVFHRPRAEG
jgi:hypothetical protein